MGVTVENANSVTAVNEELMRLYEKWFSHVGQNENYNNLNSPLLLTCSDSYYKDKATRVMLFGKEAHTSGSNFCNDISNGIGKIGYQTCPCYYSYEQGIAERCNGKRKNETKAQVGITNFLKTRLLLSGIIWKSRPEKPNYSMDRVCKAMVNNLNKSSIEGNYTPCDDIYQKIYSSFDFDGLTANIFIHELNILRPKHIVLACGTGYDEHITRAFTFDNDSVIQMKLNDLVCNEWKSTTINGKCIGLDDNYNFQIIHVPHPTAVMTTDQRKNYDKILTQFIKSNPL